MILNDTNLAILRTLAAFEGSMTVREIAEHLPDHGWVPNTRNHPAATGPSVDSVRSSLSALEWNEGMRARSLAIRSGRTSRSTTWAITDEGRRVIETENARPA